MYASFARSGGRVLIPHLSGHVYVVVHEAEDRE